MPSLTARCVLAMAAALAMLFVIPSQALAVPSDPGASTPRAGENTDFVMSGTGPGQGVRGFIANSGSTFDPVRDGYPQGNPGADFSAKDEGFAGIIHGSLVDGGGTLNLYCIDIRTSTYGGIGYDEGTWDASNVPNVGYVARLLNSYFPTVPDAPGGLANDSQQAAAVQAAIWFFTDKYVLDTSDPLHDTVAAITAAVIDAGPLVQPPPPTLSINPVAQTGPAGQTVGPFVVNSGTVDATVAATASMFRDANATQPIPNGTSVPNGTFIWLRSDTPGTATLSATATATYPTGNVYLYDHNTPGVNDAQRLIQAEQQTLRTTVRSTATFQAPGSLVVTKTISGTAAGGQGEVRIQVDCGAAAGDLPDFVIPAGATAPDSRTYPGLPAGATCRVTETEDGHTTAVDVTVTGSGQQVTIPAGGSVTAALTDTYASVPGGLVINKTMTGPGAGRQSEVRITVSCPGMTDELIIPAKALGFTKGYRDIPAGTVCTITETATGANTEVSATVVGSPQTVTVPAGESVTAELTDTYTFQPGSLTVTKTITGPAAGDQGPISITVTCDGVVLQPVFDIPAGRPAGDVSFTYTDIPTPATCNVVEDPDGSTDTVTVTKLGNGQEVTIDPGEHESAGITDTYTSVPGRLVINKTITGNGAGRQSPVRIEASCPGMTLPDFVIPAGALEATKTYLDIPPGTVCTITETANGANTEVSATVDGSPQTVTIPAGGSATASITDTYDVADGSLVVSKTIAGPEAGNQSEVTIQVRCGGIQLDDFVIPAGATGTPSRTYGGIPGDSTCIVAETIDGRTSTVSVTVEGRQQQVTVPAGETATATITDTYEPAQGALVVVKTITGPAAPARGPITIKVTCNGEALDDTVIPASHDSGTQAYVYAPVAAGSDCTVTETVDGHTTTADVTVTGSGQQVTVPTRGVVFAPLKDTYDFAAGSLIVQKRISGPMAGRQGTITIRPVCDGEALDPFTIPAGAPPGTVTHTYPDLPAGASCTGTESPNGTTPEVYPIITVGPLPVTVPPGASVTARVNNSYQSAVARIAVIKTIAGAAAGQQGEIVIATTCGGQALPDFVIPAGTGAGSQSLAYTGVPPGVTCTVEERHNGSTSTVSVSTVGDDQRLTAPVVGTATAQLLDTFTTTETDQPGGSEPEPQPESEAAATLAETGAPAGLGALVVLGVGLLAGGLLLLRIARTSRQRIGRHTQR